MSEASRARRLLIPLLIITAVLGVIHFFIWQIVTSSLDSSYSDLVGVVFVAALIFLPVGVLISYTAYRQDLKWVTYLSYIWLGFFHLMFHFSIIQLIFSLIFPHNYSYWVLYAAAVVTVWALYNGFQFPKINR